MNAFVVINVLCIFCAGRVYSMPSLVAQSAQFEQSESYSSSAVSESSYSASSSSSSVGSCSGINNIALYQDAFGLASICNTEAELYMNYLNQLSDSQLSAFDQLISIYSSQSYSMAEYVTDFVAFQNEMSNIYNVLQAQSLYAANADWMTATSVYQQVQANLATALGYTTQGSCLYDLLTYANTNVNAIPLIAGCCYHLANLQNKYYSASSSTSNSYSSSGLSSTTTSSSSCTSTTGTTTAAAFDTTVYQKAFGLASIPSAETQLYINYLNQVSASEISYFDQLISIFNSQSYAMSEYVTDFVAFQNEMSNIYNALQAQSLYAANADWMSATSVYQQVQANLATALGYTTQGSCLYNLLTYANTNVNAIPLIAGCCYHLANLQNKYYSASSSTSNSYSSSGLSSTTTSSSSCTSTTSGTTTAAAFDTTVYQKAFGLASIPSAETQLYINYLNQVSASEISYFDQLISIFNSQSYAMSEYVTDFVAFQSEMSNIYNALQAQSLYAANADWMSATSVYQQVQANLATALGYTTQGSCLYNLLTYANTNVNSIPLIAGCCYHLAQLQGQFYTASSGSSSSYQASSSSYEASSMSSASSMMQSSSGSAVTVC